MRKTTPTFATSILLKTSSKDEMLLKRNFFGGKQLYNAFLCEAFNRMDRVKSDPLYVVALKINRLANLLPVKNKNDAKAKQHLNESKTLFKSLNEFYLFFEYALQSWGNKFTPTSLNIGTDAFQKLATHVFLALNKTES